MLTAAVALQIPAVQTAVAKRVLAAVEDKFDGEMSFSKLSFLPFNTLIVKDVTILDNAPLTPEADTLFTAGSITARFTLRTLMAGEGIHLASADLRNASLRLATEDGDKYKNNLARVFRLTKKDREKSDKEIFSIRKVIIGDFNFRLINCKAKKTPYHGSGINWNDLDLVADIRASKLRFAGGVMTGKAENVSLREKSGYAVEKLSGEARVGRGRAEIEDIKLKDAWSDVSLPHFNMAFANSRSFKHFVDEVTLDADLAGSILDFNTLEYFAPALKDNGTVAEIFSGSVNGPVSGLNIGNFAFRDLSSGIEGMLQASLSGLPSIADLQMDCGIENLEFTAKSLPAFISQWARGASFDLGDIAAGEEFVFDGKASGNLSDLDVKGAVSSGSGAITANLNISDITGSRPLTISGNIGTGDLDIGRIIGKDFIHECSLDTRLKATLADGGASVRVDSLDVSRLNVLGYDYSGIRAAGTFSQKAFDGRIVCNDPNLNFMFQGLFNLSRRNNNALYRFYAYLGYADLHALKIDGREISRVSIGSINANYQRVTKGDLTGTIDANSLILEGEDGRHDMGDLHINSRSGEDSYNIVFDSEFADGNYRGSKSIGEMVKAVKEITVGKELAALFGKPEKPGSGDTYRIDFDFHDTRNLLSFIAPGSYISDSTSIRLNISDNGRLTGRISSPRIAFREKYVKGLSLDLDNGDDALNCTLTGSEISISPSIRLLNNALMLYAHDNSIGLGFNYDNRTEPENRGELYLTGDLSGSTPGHPVLEARSLTSNIYFNGDRWHIEPASYSFSGGDLRVNELRISNGEQSIRIDGAYSKISPESLSLDVNRFDLSLVNSIIDQDLSLGGLASGKVTLSSPSNYNFGLDVNLVSENTRIAGKPAGKLMVESSWDEAAEGLVFALRNELGGSTGIDARGFFRPEAKSLQLDTKLDRFDFGYAAPFLTSVFSEVSGALTGNVSASGTLDALNVRGDRIMLDNGLLRIAFTNVPYRVNGPMHLDNNGLHFDNLSVADREGGSGSVDGGILFDHFKDISMDTRIKMDNIECLNTAEKDNNSFYGNVFGTGRMNITGPFDALALDIEATTVKTGSFHIPLNSASSSKGSDLLVFKQPEKQVYIDPYELMMNKMSEAKAKSSDMSVRLKVNATPGTEANLELDKASGNVLTGNGAGTIALEIRPAKDIFTINGDYTLNSGNFHFNALGIAAKDFSILNGSSIKFNGDIMDSDLDINAQYSIKTSLSALIADTTAVSTRRTVDCGINISDKLNNPQLAFSIDIPDLDPTTKSRVESALSTDDKVQKQFIALLVTNNFLPDDQSGIVNNSNLLYSNFADIMSNQLNNILQKLEIPLDLGLKYQESGTGTSIFDVALSTQLFNNRVSVNGNIGNRQHLSSGNEDVVGDLDIEIKMDRSGEVRLNLFSHSADEYTNYLDNSQRNGVGVAYQKEFDKLADFFKGLFCGREKRQALEMEQNTAERGKVTINID